MCICWAFTTCQEWSESSNERTEHLWLWPHWSPSRSVGPIPCWLSSGRPYAYLREEGKMHFRRWRPKGQLSKGSLLPERSDTVTGWALTDRKTREKLKLEVIRDWHLSSTFFLLKTLVKTLNHKSQTVNHLCGMFFHLKTSESHALNLVTKDVRMLEVAFSLQPLDLGMSCHISKLPRRACMDVSGNGICHLEPCP